MWERVASRPEAAGSQTPPRNSVGALVGVSFVSAYAFALAFAMVAVLVLRTARPADVIAVMMIVAAPAGVALLPVVMVALWRKPLAVALPILWTGVLLEVAVVGPIDLRVAFLGMWAWAVVILWGCWVWVPDLHVEGTCPRCHYDLRASVGRCPECGEKLGPSDRR